MRAEGQTGVFLVREEALPIGRALEGEAALGCKLITPWVNNEQSAREQFIALYRKYNQWVLVMAAGIAVRFCSGLLHLIVAGVIMLCVV